MKDLRIGMNILATTTCYLDNEVFKLHPTTLVYAYESDNKYQKGLQIKLGNGHWGACPTRSRDEVCINSKEVIKLAKKSLAKHIELTKDNKPKHNLYFVKVNNTHSITISIIKFSRTVNSLAEGSYTEYSGRYISMKIHNALPHGFFYSLDDAIKFFAKSFSF